MLTRYACCGLTIDSELPLPCASVPARADLAPDVSVRLLRHAWLPGEQTGRSLASERSPGWGEITREAEGYRLGYRDLCTFVISEDGGRLDAYVPPAVDLERASHLCIGNPLAVLIALRDGLSLHASAVACTAGALVIAGDSGAGKSTLAAWLVRDGGALIADDLLRVQGGASSALCYPGVVELRLRPDAVLPDGPAGRITRIAYDGRHVLRSARACAQPTPVRAVLCPQLDGSATSGAKLEALAPIAAFTALARTVRPSGALDPQLRALQFRELGALVRTAPVFALRGRWHPDEVLAALAPLRAKAARARDGAGAVPVSPDRAICAEFSSGSSREAEA